MQAEELLWAILPEGLEEEFEIESYRKEEQRFVIVLVEKNRVPRNLPLKYRGKRIINNVLSPLTMNDFSLRGRKTELVLKRRYWQFEGIKEMYCQPFDFCAPGTKLSQELAAFLKAND